MYMMAACIPSIEGKNIIPKTCVLILGPSFVHRLASAFTNGWPIGLLEERLVQCEVQFQGKGRASCSVTNSEPADTSKELLTTKVAATSASITRQRKRPLQYEYGAWETALNFYAACGWNARTGLHTPTSYIGGLSQTKVQVHLCRPLHDTLRRD